jgi:hypothetical protein
MLKPKEVCEIRVRWMLPRSFRIAKEKSTHATGQLRIGNIPLLLQLDTLKLFL